MPEGKKRKEKRRGKKKITFSNNQNIVYSIGSMWFKNSQLIQITVLKQCGMCLKLDGPKNMLMFFFMQYTLYRYGYTEQIYNSNKCCSFPCYIN